MIGEFTARFVTFLVILDPLGVAVIFAGLMDEASGPGSRAAAR
jgi:small neutral amino acid transporter SnatA (MarC family)